MESTMPETMNVGLLHFYYIKNKYCVEMYVHCIIPLVVQSYILQDDDLNPLTPMIYTTLNGNFLFNLHYIFPECKPGVK